jgi:hypothetical protein
VVIRPGRFTKLRILRSGLPFIGAFYGLNSRRAARSRLPDAPLRRRQEELFDSLA